MSLEIVSCSKTITIHSLQVKQPLSNYNYHRGFVNSLSINHNNKVIASCGQDGKLFLVTAQKPENKLIQHNFSPNAKEKPSSLNTCAFSHNSKYIAVGSVDSVIKVWDIRGDNTAKKQPNITQIKSHMCGITSLAWIKQLKPEQFGSQVLASSSSSGDIFIHSNKNGVFSEVSAFKMQEGINCIKVSEGPDYSRLAACTSGGTLALWDLLNGKDKPFWQTSSNQSKVSLTSLSISSYSPVLLVTASMNESLMFYDIHQRKSVKTIATDQPLNCVGLHANGHTLVAGGMYGSCFVYDLRNPVKPQNKLAGHQTTIKHLQFFKAKQKQSSTVISETRSNKSNSIVNGSIGVSQGQIQQKLSPASNNFVAEFKSKENKGVPQQKTSNLANINSNSIQTVVTPPPMAVKKELVSEQLGREKKIQPKLSAATQESIKNNSTRPQSLSRFNDPVSNELYRNRQPANFQVPLSFSSRQGQARQLKEVNKKVLQIQLGLKQTKQEMYQMQQRLNMSVIKQFQIHQTQMKCLLQNILSRQCQKDEYIKRLEAQNNMLKHFTF